MRVALRAAGAAALMAALVALGLLRRVEVDGVSMAPSLLPGDRLLVLRRARLRPGSLVVVAGAGGRELVKRVAAGPGDAVVVGGRTIAAGADEVVVLGDNAAASTDSRSLGPLPRSAVRGRPLYRYAPAERAGRL